MALRLHTVRVNGVQYTVDIEDGALVLYDGAFVDPHTAPAITLAMVDVACAFTPFGADAGVALTLKQQRHIAICTREDIPNSEVQPSEVIIAEDPTDGECLCGITCLGPNLRYVKVVNV